MRSYTFTTDAIDPDEPIVIQGPACTRVIIYENDQAGTADYKLRFPLSTSPQITRPAGAKTELFAPIYGGSSAPTQFKTGDTIAYISSASGSLTMVQEEH